MALEVKNSPLVNGVSKCTSDYKTRNKKRPGHNGMDLISGNSKNNYVIAIDSGKVTATSYDSKSGYYVFVEHENGYKSFYCHLLKGSIVVKKNQKIEKGKRLATMGNSGASTGTHLHFACKNTKKEWIDPKPYLEGTKDFGTKKHYSGEYPKIPLRGYFKLNDKGKEVIKLQKLLNWSNGSKLVCDGILGKKTITQVDLFESNNKLQADGKFGKKCLAVAKTITK